MAKQTYIKMDTTVVCTNMTIPSTSIIGVEDERKAIKKTFKGSESRPLLNVDDKKLKMSFSCKMPPKKWGGLSLKCLGMLIVGAIIIVATGGVAGPFLIAAMVVAGIGFVGGIAWTAYSTYHACDQTLDPPCKWHLYHRKVSIESKRALLNKSIMVCSNGGVINIIIDPVIALNAAKYISGNNNKEITIHLLSQLVYGGVEWGTGGLNPISTAISIGLYCWQEPGTSTVPLYAQEILAEEQKKDLEEGSFWGTVPGTIVQEGGNALIGEGASAADDILERSWKNYKFDWKSFAKGIGISIATSVIDYFINMWEASIYEDTVEKSKDFNEDDYSNHIGIYAIHAQE